MVAETLAATNRDLAAKGRGMGATSQRERKQAAALEALRGNNEESRRMLQDKERMNDSQASQIRDLQGARDELTRRLADAHAEARLAREEMHDARERAGLDPSTGRAPGEEDLGPVGERAKREEQAKKEDDNARELDQVKQMYHSDLAHYLDTIRKMQVQLEAERGEANRLRLEIAQVKQARDSRTKEVRRRVFLKQC